MSLRIVALPFAAPVPLLIAAIAIGCDEPSPPPPERAPLLDSAAFADEHDLATPLVCPGSRGCELAGDELLAGVAAQVITPAVETWDDLDGDGRRDADEPFVDQDGDGEWDGYWLAGFSMGRAATGVHDDIWARAVTFERGDVSVGLVALDLVGLFYNDVVRLRRAAKDAGLDLDHLVVTTTHVHEAPDTMGIFGPDPSASGYDPDYVAFVLERALLALTEAKQSQRRARLEVAQRATPAFIADSRLPVLIDEVITAVKLVGDDDVTFGTLAVWGNHPEALGGDNTLITSDYPHYLRAKLEDAFPGSRSVFFAGVLGGLMNPLHVVGCPDESGAATCANGDFEKARYIGEGVAQIALDALGADDVIIDDDAQLGVRRKAVLIRGSNTKLAIAAKAGLIQRPVYTPEGARIGPELLELVPLEELFRDYRIGTEVDVVSVGPLEVVAIPGELYPELWLVNSDGTSFIERPDGADFPDAEEETPLQAALPEGRLPVVLNNANDAVGYILPKAQFDARAPWAYDPDGGQYGEENSLGEEAGPTLTRAVAELYELTPFTSPDDVRP